MQGQIEPILEPLRAAYEAERLQQYRFTPQATG